MYEFKFDVVAFMRVHGLRCSKVSASYSARCRAAAHCSRSQISLITWREALSARASASWVEPGLYSLCQHKRGGALSGGFGFQTKVNDRFLNQRRRTCWYSCRKKKHTSPVSDIKFSLTFLFVFVLKSLLSLLFTSHYAMEAFFHYFLYYYLFDSSVFAKHSVIY